MKAIIIENFDSFKLDGRDIQRAYGMNDIECEEMLPDTTCIGEN